MAVGFSSGSSREDDPPYAERRFRHRETGEVAVLSVRLTYPPGGPFHAVITSRPDGSNVPGIMWGTWAKDVEQAREVWSRRQRELRELGYAREDHHEPMPGRGGRSP